MKKIIGFTVLSFLFVGLVSLKNHQDDEKYYSVADLKKIYSSGDVSKWPKPTVDSSVVNFHDLKFLLSIYFLFYQRMKSFQPTDYQLFRDICNHRQ